MKRIWDTKENCLMAIDGEYEFELAYCYARIAAWKQWYCRKNSKLECNIKLRVIYPDGDTDHWKFYIECVQYDAKKVRHNIVEQTRICKEAYDVLARDKKSEQLQPGVDIVFIHEFKPTIK